ncbi:AmpG family muropeptide MFS transporter [Neisseriaceae bacterium ESL0693]|nr:AmpG family muropeptide MFS transporter [Neisseriaceae bacterium ESL0693]
MRSRLSSFWHMLWSRPLLICVFTGFSSGLPLYFLINLMPVWLRSEGIDLVKIGLTSLIGLPFTWKFLWAPILDETIPPFLGRRRGWMAITQILLLLTLASFAFIYPHNIYLVLCVAFIVAFLSASQDVVLDAFRREILTDTQLGLGNAIHVNAYRIAALVPGSLSLILADYYPWHWVFPITALFMLPGLFMTLFMAHEPHITPPHPKTLKQSIIEPLQEFLQRKGIQNTLLVLSFIFLYKLGDSMATALATPFYMDLGFSKTEIGLIAKSASLWPALLAAIIGGIWMMKLGINRALWLFGLVQIVSILGFVWLAGFGHFSHIGSTERWMLGLVIGFEACGVGLGTAAFVAYIARETNPAFTATQMALFTSLAALPRTVFNSGSGLLIQWLGYVSFFWLCFALAIPGMLLLVKVAPWHDKT